MPLGVLSSGEVLKLLFTFVVARTTPRLPSVHIKMASVASVPSSRREALDMSRPVRSEIMVW